MCAVCVCVLCICAVCVISASIRVVLVCLQAALPVVPFTSLFLVALKTDTICHSNILLLTDRIVTVAVVCLSYLSFISNRNSEKEFIISSHSD